MWNLTDNTIWTGVTFLFPISRMMVTITLSRVKKGSDLRIWERIIPLKHFIDLIFGTILIDKVEEPIALNQWRNEGTFTETLRKVNSDRLSSWTIWGCQIIRLLKNYLMIIHVIILIIFYSHSSFNMTKKFSIYWHRLPR